MDFLTILEWLANAFYLVSVVLAAKNNINTWWTGIVGTLLFAILFFKVQLYADVTLMLFYLGTSVYGWSYWRKGTVLAPISQTRSNILALFTFGAVLTTLLYGVLLHIWTDAYAPFIDSAILMFSVLAQLLLMRRRIETWVFWLLVDTIAVPLYFSRGLELTAILYVGFWLNAVYGYWSWRRELLNQQKEIPTPV